MKLLQGDEERRINRNEPEPEPAALQGIDLKAPPRGIGAKSAAVWRRLAPDLVDKHVLTTWDVDLFAAYCDAIVRYGELKKLARAAGYTDVGSQKQLVRHPVQAELDRALGQMLKLAARFGTTPADRAGLVVNPEGHQGQQGAERLLS